MMATRPGAIDLDLKATYTSIYDTSDTSAYAGVPKSSSSNKVE